MARAQDPATPLPDDPDLWGPLPSNQKSQTAAEPEQRSWWEWLQRFDFPECNCRRRQPELQWALAEDGLMGEWSGVVGVPAKAGRGWCTG